MKITNYDLRHLRRQRCS